MKSKKLMKVMAPVFMVSLSGAVLAGCGTNNQAANTGNGSQAKAQSSSDKGPLKIIMWVNPPAVAAVKKIDAEFQKKYGVKVQLQTTANDTSGYKTLQQTAVQAGTADIMAIQPFDPMPQKMNSNNMSKTQEWAVHNVFVPLNNESWISDFKQNDLNAAAYKGKDYGLVTGVYQTGIFYNKAMFKKYNLKVPTTYNQFISVAKTLKSHNVTPVWTGLAGGATFYTEFMMYPLLQDIFAPSLNGGSVSTALASGKIKWTDPKMQTVFNREKNIASNYLEKNYAGQNWQQMPGAFAAGKAAMLLDGSWDLASVEKANPNMKIGYFPLPGSNTASDNNSVANADLTWTILNNGKHKALAKKWLAFFASKKIYSQYVDMTGISPSESGTFNSKTATIMGQWFGKGRLIKQTADWLIPSGPYYLQSKNFWAAQLKMLQGGMTPTKLAQNYQKSQDQALK
ncbi:ABC transporter substrate-binding protein [Alicyclobacillus sp. SO9]|uniref:ABC transporter substrate-binding protein n=1 Tax=Alicyclobacillus sp. SO9 TaxID=2665646 RepID=UPI0018E8DBFA|nr:extracellular solute-binding protein [Alicyclobacillus sp. SO9]QQE79245.1 extracellular solute-binding protein [Alicyclobacillus sp. SO9]